MIDLNYLGEKWLELKKQRMQNLLKIALPDEALYREIMLSLGYPSNKVNFLELALITPYSEIKKLREKQTIEKALLYRAGFTNDRGNLPEDFDFSLRMDKSVWNYKGIRPANYPDKRIKGISNLLSKTVETGLVNFFLNNILNTVNNKNFVDAIKSIMDFEGIGIQRKQEMFFNIILPFYLVFSQDNEIHKFLIVMFENSSPPYENKLIKNFKMLYPDVKIANSKTYMGAIYYLKEKNKGGGA
ncbi:MAG TPA: DUF2851 family protein [bacterium]|nr:DUF2851 family protein [bacterium]HOL34467.1 DUF2851 family protein [bacterium]